MKRPLLLSLSGAAAVLLGAITLALFRPFSVDPMEQYRQLNRAHVTAVDHEEADRVFLELDAVQEELVHRGVLEMHTLEMGVQAIPYEQTDALKQELRDIIAQYNYEIGMGFGQNVEGTTFEITVWARPEHIDAITRDVKRIMESFNHGGR